MATGRHQPIQTPEVMAAAPPMKADGVGKDAEREAFDPLPVPPTGLQSSKAKKVMTRRESSQPHSISTTLHVKGIAIRKLPLPL